MSDPRKILERAARRIDPRSDAFERLDRRRERKARNRRVTAGVVALLVAIGGSYTAFTVFRGSSGNLGAVGDSGFHALWPEVTLADAQQAQAQADAGDPALTWRLSPSSVAGEFVNQAFGWDGFSVHAVGGADPTTVQGPVEMLVQSPTVACVVHVPCPVLDQAGGPLSAVVVLDRLVNPDGIWSVVEVYNPSISLRLPISPGATVVSGQEFLVPFQVPDGFQAEVGYGYISTDCGGGVYTNYSSSSSARVFDVGPDGIRFTVADMSFEQNCEAGQSASVGGGMDLPNGASLNMAIDGYIFIALQPKGAQEDDPFDASLPSEIGNAPVAVAGVPVHFVPVSEAPSPAPTEPLPSVAQVSCSDAGTQVSTPVVQPQPDGVHIAVDNSTGSDLALQIDNFGGDNAPMGSTALVRPIPPGSYRVACVNVQLADLSQIDYQPLEVQDPSGIWVSTDLTSCTSASGVAGSFAGSPDGSSDIVGVQGTPVEVVTSTISGLLPTDLIEPAGYPATTDEANVRVVRDGDVVASYHLFPDSQGGWYIDSAQACEGTNLASLGSGGASSTTYPRGWFESCPDVAGTLPLDQGSEQEGADVALRFARAYLAGDDAAVAELEDPSVPKDPNWMIAGTPDGISVFASGPGDPGGLVEFGCGPEVKARTLAVAFDDGTDSASADFTVFLILRSDGWKVWGAY
jgi:hypothetical protein